ncbi:MAG: LacI family DNA-binding transcriptional regulator [Streptosporangiales bacterium]|nr:LacI family DNA-binding transcriptional regulator [Streptosporangiales bacterium]
MARVTLQTIADELGVSRTTVSNAYSRPDQLAPALRERILGAAERFGYAGPDAAARTLRRGKAGTVGLLFTETLGYILSDPFALAFLHGIAEQAEEHGSGLLLTSLLQRSGVDTAAGAIVDGFCVYCVADDDAALQAIRRRRLPVVQSRIVNDPLAAYAAIDDYAAAVDATDHLVGLGHRQLGVIADCSLPDGHVGPIDETILETYTDSDARSRLQGYFAAARKAGLSPDSVQFVRVQGNTVEAGNAAMRTLLDLTPRPTGVLGMTDLLALGALSALGECDLRAGDDVSVVGFDDIPQAAAAGLTTIRQDGRRKGREAGRLLLEWPSDPADRQVVIPVELVTRGSSGPPPTTDRPHREERPS